MLPGGFLSPRTSEKKHWAKARQDRHCLFAKLIETLVLGYLNNLLASCYLKLEDGFPLASQAEVHCRLLENRVQAAEVRRLKWGGCDGLALKPWNVHKPHYDKDHSNCQLLSDVRPLFLGSLEAHSKKCVQASLQSRLGGDRNLSAAWSMFETRCS